MGVGRALSSLISPSFLLPQALALCLSPVTLTASGNNSMRYTPWEVETSPRCACQPWRSALFPPSLLLLPFPGPTSKGTRASLGHPLPPGPRPISEPSATGFTPDSRVFYSALPGFTHFSAAAFFFFFSYLWQVEVPGPGFESTSQQQPKPLTKPDP